MVETDVGVMGGEVDGEMAAKAQAYDVCAVVLAVFTD
jgi:hypothetical protein